MNFERHFLITGASGSFGSKLKIELESMGGKTTCPKFSRDWNYSDYSYFSESRLKDIDVLVLSHGSKKDHAMEANCTSFMKIIELYRAARMSVSKPAEVWGLGSEIEFHPAWGNKDLQIYLDSKRAYAKEAAKLYHDPSLTYRHIVPAGFTSQMGPGLISGKTAVKIALHYLKKDWKYVPVTYTGFAFLNYFRFKKLFNPLNPIN
ncbi:MAG: hypothetical protein KA715_13120 [Xanthomonadaceae bacterium]|nr:hypothetical protein [Xanthomonadaceae bacterium]